MEALWSSSRGCVPAASRARGLLACVITFNAAISACEKGGQLERALELFQAMRPAACRPTSSPTALPSSRVRRARNGSMPLELLRLMAS